VRTKLLLVTDGALSPDVGRPGQCTLGLGEHAVKVTGIQVRDLVIQVLCDFISIARRTFGLNEALLPALRGAFAFDFHHLV
jgi:hypothetical protein